MPELPEVQTVVNDLNKSIKGETILGVIYCDNKKAFKGITFEKFKKEIKNRKIINVKRRAKYILISLSGEKMLIFHLKMTGHLLIISNFKFQISNLGSPSAITINKGRWIGKNLSKELQDPRNQFIHLVLELSGGRILAFSDVRKFGVVRLEDADYLAKLEEKLGPEPLSPEFDLNQFKQVLEGSNGKIKAVLMDQSRIAGIGNIYGDEILFLAGVRPDRRVKSLTKKEIEKIYKSIRPVLEKAIRYRGSSESDFRDASGKKGHYQEHSFVYRREKQKCGKCGGVVRKIRIGQRSAHYCTVCQK
jgi:formamidopyrimidine-DNA glycosylase